MPNENNENQPIYRGMNEVFEMTTNVIKEMKDGDKMSRIDFYDKVYLQAEKMEMSKANINSLISMFLKSCKDVVVELGRNGGIYKGIRQKRIDPRPRCETCKQVIRAAGNKEDVVEPISDLNL